MADDGDAEDIISLGGTPTPEPEVEVLAGSVAVTNDLPTSESKQRPQSPQPQQQQQQHTAPLDERGLSQMLERRTAGATLRAEKVQAAPSTTARSHADRFKRQFQDTSKPFVEICQHTLRSRCDRVRSNADQGSATCAKVHFEIRSLPQTEPSLGDCSYLNTCHRLDTCRYIHYELETPSEEAAQKLAAQRAKAAAAKAVDPQGTPLLPPQWLDADLRKLDTTVLGKFDVIMADPPWDSKLACKIVSAAKLTYF